MRPILLIFLAFSISYGFDASYSAYGKLLGRYVCHGGVAYNQLKQDRHLLDSAQHDWESAARSQIEKLPAEAQIAFYVNGYNLFTLDLIVTNIPLEHGIRDISDPWGRRFIPLFGDTVSLDFIEHKILRARFKEPRIHFALVCASKSCPVLSNQPYLGDSLGIQLDRAAKTFLSDMSRNSFDAETMHLSKLFDWYGDDFKKRYPSYQAFIDQTLGLSGNRRIRFKDYNWSLNRVDSCE